MRDTLFVTLSIRIQRAAQYLSQWQRLPTAMRTFLYLIHQQHQPKGVCAWTVASRNYTLTGMTPVRRVTLLMLVVGLQESTDIINSRR
jgi:hypothetical protein